MHIRELVLAYRARPSPVSIDASQQFLTPRDAVPLLVGLLSEEAVEVFGIVCLNTKRYFQAYYEVSRGSLDAATVHPRDVFKAAILANASSIILAHNHPSGDPTPSPDDRELTHKLVATGIVVGIEMADHLIVTNEGRYYSFKEAGAL